VSSIDNLKDCLFPVIPAAEQTWSRKRDFQTSVVPIPPSCQGQPEMQGCLGSTLVAFCWAVCTAVWGSLFRSVTEATLTRSCLALTLLSCLPWYKTQRQIFMLIQPILLGCSENLSAYIASKVGAGLLAAWTSPSAPEQFYPDK